jgi:hypothetical protein
MSDRQRLEQALVNADAAGDVDAARTLASALRSMPAATKAERVAELKRQNPGEYDPTSPEWQAKYGATAGMSTTDKFLAGMGKSFMDTGRGIKGLALDMLPGSSGDQYRQQIDETKRLDAPLMNTTSAKVGNFAGTVAQAAPLALIPGANTYTGAALIGAGQGLMRPVGTQDSRTMNAGLGAAGGVAGKFIGDKVITPIGNAIINRVRGGSTSAAQAATEIGPSASGAEASIDGSINAQAGGGGSTFGTVGADPAAGLTSAQQQAMAGGLGLGMRTTPGQATGSRALQQMEAKLESQPLTSGPFNAIKAGNQRVLNRSAAKWIGEDADVVDSTILAKADERLGAIFNDVRDKTPRPIDPSHFVSKVQDINDEFEGLLPDGKTIGAHPLVQRLMRYAEQGQATGEQLGGLTSKLGRAAHKEMTGASGDREMGQALYRVKDYVDDLVEQGLTGKQLATYQAARGQYRALMTLLRPGVTNSSSGNISGATLANVLQRTDRAGFTFGKNASDIYSAARFSQAFKPIVGDSGTATRSMLTSPTDFVLSLPFNIATRAYTSSPAIRSALMARAASQQAQSGLGQGLIGAAPYLPVAGGLLGANASR